MQLSIVLSRIEAEETNGSEGRLQTGGGGGGGREMMRDEMWKVGNGWIWQTGRREKIEIRVRQSKRQKGIRSRGRRGGIET